MLFVFLYFCIICQWNTLPLCEGLEDVESDTV